jgi:hypothetical protein
VGRIEKNGVYVMVKRFTEIRRVCPQLGIRITVHSAQRSKEEPRVSRVTGLKKNYAYLEKSTETLKNNFKNKMSPRQKKKKKKDSKLLNHLSKWL